ncbi:MAG: hypothetical protein ACK2U1_09925, partial [Anaerolineales bacterium]
HTIYVHARDASGNWGNANDAIATLTVDKAGPTFSSVSVSPSSAPRQNGNNAIPVDVTITGTITDNLTGVDTNSGTYTITDSKSNNVVNGTYSIEVDPIDPLVWHFTINVAISPQNNGNQNSHRYYNFTIYAADNLGNVGSATAQFTIQ